MLSPSLRKAALCAASAALLALPFAASAAGSDTKAVLGFDMSFGAKITPEVFGGLLHASENSAGHYNGVKALAYWDFTRGFTPSKVKLMGILDGRRSWQPELGVGYNINAASPFFSAGLSSQHLTGGVDFNPQAGLAPYAGVQIPPRP